MNMTCLDVVEVVVKLGAEVAGGAAFAGASAAD